MPTPFITNRFKDMSSREGHRVRLDKWLWKFEELHVPPTGARLLRNYKNTVLFELTYDEAYWGLVRIPPRKIIKMVPKQLMAIGEVTVIDLETGERLTGQNIAKFIADREEDEICRQLMKL